jgi:DNA-binding CsgD family transcriptional regulator
MSGALVIRGEAGIGKTSVLEYAVEAADEFTTMRMAGVEAEQDISFAAIHRLLVPVLSESDALPSPQKRALDGAFGRVQAVPPDRFLVGLAVLTLLSRVVGSQPLLIVVDDAQWIDGDSAHLLAFVARRLHAEGVVMLFAVRDPVEARDAFMGLPEINLAGLDPPEARQLLVAIASGPLDAATVGRIVKETGGNPLALTELGRDIGPDDRLGGLLPDEPVPLTKRLEARFQQQVLSLPEPTQRFLLIAAAEPTDVALVSKAADRLGIPVHAVEAAIDAEVFDPRRSPAFRHPLIRSAVYTAATLSERRLVHTTLADLVDASEADSRAWHLAAAASGANEALAAELERGAARAEARGGSAARAAFLARAAELTPGGPRKGERLLSAAEAALLAGAPARAQALLDRAQPMLADPLLIARARRIDAALQSSSRPGRGSSRPGRAPALLLEAAAALQAIDPLQARDTFMEALQACLVSCQLTDGTSPAAVGSAVLATLGSSAGQEIVDLMLTGLATRFAVGYREAVPSLRRGVEALSAGGIPASGYTLWAGVGAIVATELWDADGYRRILTRLEEAERQQGALESLRVTLRGIARGSMWAGDFAAAEIAHAEATEITVAVGGDRVAWDALKVELLAWQGREKETRFICSSLMDLTAATGAGVAINLARVALMMLDLAEGRYADALAGGLQIMADDPCPHGSQVLPDVVEAATRTGDAVAAHAALHRLRERAEASGTNWALGLLARSQALAVSTDPEPYYRRALDLLGKTNVKTDTARTHLLYGEWLRREKRRTDARRELRIALESFDLMGASEFAERARSELAATGENARRRRPDTAFDLTAQERQIATLAAGGATNQEVAAQLFLSPSTVDYHLRKVFRKLSVTSRRRLAPALGITGAT